ncbi:hypothetical protein G4H71_08130 [Rhodococcus triatomae]|uniref:Helicase/secretion neighborhood CpaE-like protein n=1 Tax=Rhodococcus triatomae TaxID=300028 RepID=A0A1G8IKJ4_9NOCA|nr:septum site-determining protein Ssd [Rhodococcus triatomae]QNG21079.1 hypothetical protein G4H72_22255 [Rhodococcus triatomae]QNG23007.1 hypothetical protein G4H71_08130 [Rhodococcus triatomae]SDI19403.1 helicase/secretion neighborhood CpaE-like protein [Rhodococcus triatomae]
MDTAEPRYAGGSSRLGDIAGTHDAAPAAEPDDAFVLVVVGAAALLPSIHRVAAAAGRRVVEMPSIHSPEWESAALVVLDTRAAAHRRGGVRRRSGVVIVTEGEPGLAEWKAAAEVGAESVLGLPDDEPALMTSMGERPGTETGTGAVVAVVGGCGGAGASTFSAALASASVADEMTTLLVDADTYGSGLDLTLGLESTPGLRWSGLRVESGRVSATALYDALPRASSGVRVLSCDRVEGESFGPTAAAARAVLEAARSSVEVTVCDVPRPGGEIPGAEIADVLLAESDLVALVVPATVRGCVAAEKVAGRIAQRNPNVGLVVRGPAPGGLRASDVVTAVDRPLLASMRADRAVPGMLEHDGFRLRRRSPLGEAARAVLARLAERPERVGWAA